MRVLIVGSGGREHALAWKIAQSPLADLVFAAPGSPGMEPVAAATGIAADDLAAIQEFVRSQSVDLVVIGPEAPLAAGLSDRLREDGVAVFGPSRAAARLEASKQFAKEFMQRHSIPTAGFAVFDELAAALAHVRSLPGGCVVKADGLAAGKGVTVCPTAVEAEAALREVMDDRRFGDAGDRVVIEEILLGEEASYYAITDGEHVVPLAAAQDHKRALDGDLGENTGGMGAYVPAPVVSEAVEKKVLERVVYPAIRGMAAEGMPYQGVLFVGLMIDASGEPSVVEFNVRFGDPETQPLMVQLVSDLLPLLDGSARGTLEKVAAPEVDGAAVCVVLSSGGYPRAFEKGMVLEGLETFDTEGVVVFHAGTQRDEQGRFVTAGGRVLGVTARGDDVEQARARAYAAVDAIGFRGMQFRRDIAQRALVR